MEEWKSNNEEKMVTKMKKVVIVKPALVVSSGNHDSMKEEGRRKQSTCSSIFEVGFKDSRSDSEERKLGVRELFKGLNYVEIKH